LATETPAFSDVLELEQRRLERRLGHVHVKSGTRDAVRLECGVERVFVDESTTGDVHDECGRLHQCELVGGDHARCLGSLGHVDRDEVGLRKQFIERQQSDAELLRTSAGHVGVVGDNVHPERLKAGRDECADTAEADDADGLFVELGSGVLRSLPGTGGEAGMRGRDEAGHADDVADGEFGGRDDVGCRSVDNHHTGRGGRLDVNVVEANSSACDDLEGLRGGECLCVHLGGGTDQNSAGLRECFEQRGAVGTVHGADLEVGPEGVDSSG
jgi:hypothetical protein